MILLRIFFSSGLFERNFLEQPIIVYEASLLIFDNDCLNHVRTLCALLSLMKKQKERINTILGLSPVQKADDSIQDRSRNIGPMFNFLNVYILELVCRAMEIRRKLC